MLPAYNRVKGVHPGAILKRELKKRELKSIDLAKSIDEHPQTINAITKEKRGINPKLSIKLGEYFGTEPDYFMILQASFEVSKAFCIKYSNQNQLQGKVRKAIFWDVDMEKIDIHKNKRFIIKRILERGNQQEIKTLISIYTLPVIENEIKNLQTSFIPNYERNIEKYIYPKG